MYLYIQKYIDVCIYIYAYVHKFARVYTDAFMKTGPYAYMYICEKKMYMYRKRERERERGSTCFGYTINIDDSSCDAILQMPWRRC